MKAEDPRQLALPLTVVTAVHHNRVDVIIPRTRRQLPAPPLTDDDARNLWAKAWESTYKAWKDDPRVVWSPLLCEPRLAV